MIVAPAPACRVVDTSYRTTAAVRAALTQLGYWGIVRYVPLPGVNWSADIDAEELAGIVADGFGSWWVQHPRFPGWHPRDCDPENDARCAVIFAKRAGYLPGCHGFVDAEGMSADTTAADAFAYNSRWAHVVVSEGYRAGLYDGYSQPETPEELYTIHDVDCYWSDAAHRRVAVRGCAVVQGQQFSLHGVPFDPDIVAPDLLGGTPWWVGSDPAAERPTQPELPEA